LTWKAIQRWALLNRPASLECYSNEDIRHFVDKLYYSADLEDHPLQLRFFCSLLNCALERAERQEEEGESSARAAIIDEALTTCAVTIPQWSSADVKALVRWLRFPSRERWLRIPLLNNIGRRLYNRLTASDRAELIFDPEILARAAD
jgi:hypothetical protein